MAFTSYNSGSSSSIVRKFDDIALDFPPNGVVTSLRVEQAVIISGTITTDVTISITLDKTEDIESGTATWVVYQTVVDADNRYIEIPIGGTGLKISTSDSGITAWIVS